MKQLLSATVLMVLAAGSLTGCGGEPGGQPSHGSSVSSSPTAAVTVSPEAPDSPTTSHSPTPSAPATSGSTTDATAVVVESIDGDWLTANAENAVAVIEKDGTVEGFEIVLGGSGTQACAPSIRKASVEGTSLEIILAPLATDRICTADYRPYNFRLLFPDAETIETVHISHDPNIGPQETFTKDDFITGTR